MLLVLSPGIRRLKREAIRVGQEEFGGMYSCVFRVLPSTENVKMWNVEMYGPVGTPFQFEILKLQLKFSDDFPMRPPSVRFESKLLHVSIHSNGKICSKFLQDHWNPRTDMLSFLMNIHIMLRYPNPAYMANSKAYFMSLNDEKEYEKQAKLSMKIKADDR